MDFKPFTNAIPYIAAGLVSFTAFWGGTDILFSIASHFHEWLRAKRYINTEIPALVASVTELRGRQSRVERELEQIRTGTTN